MLDSIPLELKDLPQWVVWKLEIVNDRLTKVPYIANALGKKASSNNPGTWTTFKNAVFAFENEKVYSGIGFVFSETDPYVGIDFDKCIDKETGLVKPSLEQDILSLNSYTEISQSGTGLHVIGRGINPAPDKKGTKKGNVEMYSYGRYFAITGNTYSNFPTAINDIPAKHLEYLYKKYLLSIPSETKPKTLPEMRSRGGLFLCDEDILSLCENASNSSKFNKLWHGNTLGYPSQSEAELALCNIFAFYTKDSSQLERLLKSSGLYRSKLERNDYVTVTIGKSLMAVSAQYDPKAKMRNTWLKRRAVMRGDGSD